MALSDDDKKWLEQTVNKAVAAALAKEQANGRNLRQNVLAIARKLDIQPVED